ncbi:MAG: SDR family NAD(P)-dependent oxidoreductase [Paludibacter sp.]|jgi:NAD(P)-dependent dehydrogenase (short-subunit alcohol dehydrogenase family)|nr:SDR family NAD(P)-dependent oxidoreductase [Paludibacter sp.]
MESIKDKVIVITGGSSGIGAAAARELSARGAKVVITGRSAATEQLAKEIGGDYFLVDYTRLSSIRNFAEQLLQKYPRIDVLVNNVGGVLKERYLTPDGLEQTFQVNHLSGFLLTLLLRERLEASQALVINTSSMANRMGRLAFDDLQSEKSYNAMGVYGSAKLMNILHAMEITRRFKGVKAASFHPGVVRTGFARDGKGFMRWAYESFFGKLVMISPEEGADTLIWLITTTGWKSGEYFYKRKPGLKNRLVTDANAARLWEVSEKLCQ